MRSTTSKPLSTQINSINNRLIENKVNLNEIDLFMNILENSNFWFYIGSFLSNISFIYHLFGSTYGHVELKVLVLNRSQELRGDEPV